MKQAGGDEDKANELLTQGSKETQETAEANADVEAPKKKKKKKGKKKKKKVEDVGADADANADADVTSAKDGEKKSSGEDDDLSALGLDI